MGACAARAAPGVSVNILTGQHIGTLGVNRKTALGALCSAVCRGSQPLAEGADGVAQLLAAVLRAEEPAWVSERVGGS